MLHGWQTKEVREGQTKELRGKYFALNSDFNLKLVFTELK